MLLNRLPALRVGFRNGTTCEYDLKGESDFIVVVAAGGEGDNGTLPFFLQQSFLCLFLPLSPTTHLQRLLQRHFAPPFSIKNELDGRRAGFLFRAIIPPHITHAQSGFASRRTVLGRVFNAVQNLGSVTSWCYAAA